MHVRDSVECTVHMHPGSSSSQEAFNPFSTGGYITNALLAGKVSRLHSFLIIGIVIRRKHAATFLDRFYEAKKIRLFAKKDHEELGAKW